MFSLVILTSCNEGKIDSLNEKIDSLVTANTTLQRELDNYKLSPAKLLAEIEEDYKNKHYASIKINLGLLKDYHPESTEYISAKEIYEQSLKDIEISKKKAKEKAEKAEAERKAKMAPIKRVMEKYGCSKEDAEQILGHSVRRGMTAELCRASWGRPTKINRTIGSYGVHEQWCYGGHNYLYFEDGILTTIQN